VFRTIFIRDYIKRDMYHGVSEVFARQRAAHTADFKAGKISSLEYHRRMDKVHEAFPQDLEKIKEASNVL
jgi:hypothetical protein